MLTFVKEARSFALMTKDGVGAGTTEIVAKRVRQLRDKYGWSARELARRCEEAGGPKLDQSVISNLELGRRGSVSIDEVLVLALVLDVAPVHLFVPVEDEAVEVGRWTVGSPVVREWVRGRYPLPSQDSRRYWTEVPDHEWDAVEAASRGAAAQSTPEEIRAFDERMGAETRYVPPAAEDDV